MTTHRLMCCGFIAFCAALALGGCGRQHERAGKGRRLVIGVSLMSLSTEYIVMLNKALEPKARELAVELIVNDAERSAEKQIQQVESFIAQRVDAIILNPCEVEASSPAVDQSLAAGIPIVNLNSETRSAPTAFVGSRDEEAARIAMEYIARRLNGRGNIVMMHGFMGQAAQIKRDRGAREVLARNPGLRLLADQTAEWDRAKGMSLMENWIQSYGGSYGYIDYDSNASCVIDGLRREDAIWSHPPPPGTYTARGDAPSLCGRPIAYWTVRALLHGVEVAHASGVAVDADTRGSHGLGSGVLALQLTVP